MALQLYLPMKPVELKSKPEKLEELMDDTEWCIQLKKDGVRGELHINPDGDGKNRIFSGNAGVKDKTKPLEMSHNMPTICSHQFPKSWYGCVFDCEIFHPKLTSAELSGMINPNRVKAPDKLEPEFEFWVFDLPVWGGILLDIMILKERLRQLAKMFETKEDIHTVNRVLTYLGSKKREMIEQWLASGEEGGVLKRLDSKYHFSFEKEGKKVANTWYKYKKSYEGDFIIIGTQPSEMLYEGEHMDTHKYWQGATNGLYEGLRRHPSDIALNKWYYKGWIGSVEFATWVDETKWEAHKIKYPNTDFRGMRIDTPGFAEKPGYALIKVGKSSGFTEELREKLSNNFNRDYLGRVVKLTAMQQYPDTLALRHPALSEGNIRYDKLMDECVMDLEDI